MLRVMFTLLLVLMSLLPTTAQDASVEVALGGGYSVVLPDGWEIPTPGVSPIFEIDEAFSPVLVVHSDDIFVQLMSPASVSGLFEDVEDDIALGDALLVSMATLYENDLTGLGAETVGVKEADLATYEGVFWQTITSSEGTELSRRHYLLRVDDSGSFLAADVYAEGAKTLQESEETVHALLESVVVGGSSETESQASGEPCFVSTQTARTATVRVGPGENRTALLFLPVGKEFTVTGRIVLDDETVWYQLDKTQVDPNTSASELWVAQSLVDEVGDCALVGETSAPPIRPIMSAPPATGGGNTSGGGSAPAGSLPQSGTWTMTLGSRGLVSCLGTNTVEFNTSQVYGSDLSDTYNLTANPSTDSFVMGGQAFTRLPSGAFTGALSFNNGSVGINFYVQNTGFMSGELVYNENIQGLQCSFTIPLSASRN